RGLVRPPAGSRNEEDDAPTARPTSKTPTRAIFAGLAAAALVWLLWRRLTRVNTAHPASGFLNELERRLDSMKLRLRGEDLETLSRRLVDTQHPLAHPVSAATRRYLEARFGGRPLSAKERRSLLEALG
ncbi:MAG: DUF4129 domain-containing protein, partial [Archangium sp.]